MLVLHRFVQLAKNKTYVRGQDFYITMSYIAGNPVGNPIVWRFLQSEWDYLVDRFVHKFNLIKSKGGQIQSLV